MDKKAVHPLDTVVDPNAKKPAEKKRPIHWRDFDATKVKSGAYKNGQFGPSTSRTYGDAATPVIVQCPDARVVHAPSAWTEEQEAKYGSKFGPLKADRKSDKWTMTIGFANKDFEHVFRNEIVKQARQDLFDNRQKWAGANWKEIPSPEALFSKLPNPMQESASVTGEYELKVSMRSAVGSSDLNCAFIDFDTNEPWPVRDKPIGPETMIRPVIDFSDMFVGKEAKLYCTLRLCYVHADKYVPPRKFDADNYVIEKNRD